MLYPTVREVVAADREQICRWWRFLPPPEGNIEERVLHLVRKKFTCLGGFTLEIERKIATEKREIRVR